MTSTCLLYVAKDEKLYKISVLFRTKGESGPSKNYKLAPIIITLIFHLSSNVSKLSFGCMRPVKIQISLCIRVVRSESSLGAFCITKTCLYNSDPLKPHFYIVKLGFAGVYIIFLISAQNIDCGYSLEPPRRGGSNEYPQSMF